MSPVARFARAAANGKSNASTVHDSEDCYVRDVSELVIQWRERENTEGQVRVGQGACEENAKDIKWRAKGSLKVGGK